MGMLKADLSCPRCSPAAANFALCCPSRSTILTSQCAHNTGVVGVGGDMGMLVSGAGHGAMAEWLGGAVCRL